MVYDRTDQKGDCYFVLLGCCFERMLLDSPLDAPWFPALSETKLQWSHESHRCRHLTHDCYGTGWHLHIHHPSVRIVDHHQGHQHRPQHTPSYSYIGGTVVEVWTKPGFAAVERCFFFGGGILLNYSNWNNRCQLIYFTVILKHNIFDFFIAISVQFIHLNAALNNEVK